MIFIEDQEFQKRRHGLMGDEELFAMMGSLVRHPEAGKVIPGSGGVLKLRWAGGGHGKRGGLRIIYYWWLADDKVLLLDIYAKNDREKLDARSNYKTETKGCQMKRRSIREMIYAKEQIERGAARPAKVWDVRPDESGGFTRKAANRETFRRRQKAAWEKSIARTREKLGLSQLEFARLLGISVRTLHHWEQGTRQPSGAARVLLRVAAAHPEMVLQAA